MPSTTFRGSYTAPATYAELYLDYKPMICHLVARAGIVPQDVDDVAHAIIEKIIGHDMLADYDPTMLHETENGRKRARFNTFLSGIVVKYVRHHCHRQQKQARREPILLDAEVDADEDSGITMAETKAMQFGLYSDDGTGHVEGQMIVEAIVTSLDNHTQRGQRDLSGTIRLVAEQVDQEGQVNRSEIAAMLGVSSSSVSNIFSDLKKELVRRGYSMESLNA